jgi:hypothetical protein
MCGAPSKRPALSSLQKMAEDQASALGKIRDRSELGYDVAHAFRAYAVHNTNHFH